jgi:hypothetical protein
LYCGYVGIINGRKLKENTGGNVCNGMIIVAGFIKICRVIQNLFRDIHIFGHDNIINLFLYYELRKVG